MAVNTQAAALGRRGEEHAVAHIEQLGWKVVDRNWRCNQGELDIVALDEATETLVVVEVKCRSGRGFGDPLEAVTDVKASRLVRLAAAWVREKQFRVRRVRIDAIGIIAPPGAQLELSHVRGIGGW